MLLARAVLAAGAFTREHIGTQASYVTSKLVQQTIALLMFRCSSYSNAALPMQFSRYVARSVVLLMHYYVVTFHRSSALVNDARTCNTSLELETLARYEEQGISWSCVSC
jgi:hypothetical protein